MIEIWGLGGALAAEAAEKRAVNAGKALLNGPARPGQGLVEAGVDMVLGPASVSRSEEMAPLIEFGEEHIVEAAAEDFIVEMPAAEPFAASAHEIDEFEIDAEPAIAEVPQPRPQSRLRLLPTRSTNLRL